MKAFLSSISLLFVALTNVQAMEPFDYQNLGDIEFCDDMIKQVRSVGFVNDFVQLNGVNVLSRETFHRICTPLEFFIVNQNALAVGINVLNNAGEAVKSVQDLWLQGFLLQAGTNNATANFTQFRVDFQSDPSNSVVIVENNEQFINMAIQSVIAESNNRGPGVFCVNDRQCAGARLQRAAGSQTARVCEQNADGINTCNKFVAEFTLRWLLAYILASYLILIVWAIYIYVPICRRKFCPKKSGSRGSRGGKPKLNDQEQLLINTLATQCASAENLMLIATDYVKQGRLLENINTIEAKREARLMIYVTEYFQSVCAIMVALTHQYLHKKSFVEGEVLSIEDITARALQLEVLNYVRSRIQLAFNNDPMTDKSLSRLAEAYVILKKVSDAHTFVGFSFDKQSEGSLGSVSTPIVNFNENSFFLGGLWKSAAAGRSKGMEQYENSKVCITLNEADVRDYQKVEADLYLNQAQKDSKVYDPMMMTTATNSVGKALSFSNSNAAQDAGSQTFVRSFWGPEISEILNETKKWLSTENALEEFLKHERLEREQKAQPLVKQTKQKKKRKRKKRKNEAGESEYVDEGEQTVYTEASEAGWAVSDNNIEVYNVESVTAHGLGIAGKHGMPFDKVNETPVKKSSKLYSFFETHFPNFAEWPKFHFFIFILMPIVILIPWIAKARTGAEKIDVDGNVGFKARVAGFGLSYLGVPAYYFIDARIPDLDELVTVVTNSADPSIASDNAVFVPADQFQLVTDGLVNDAPFGEENRFAIPNEIALEFFDNDWNGGHNRRPDEFLGEVQAGILAQADVEALTSIRNQQLAQEITTMFVYGLMHIGAYFFGLIPLTLIRESLEILARYFKWIKEIYPISLWRDLHMNMGLCGILFVVFGATVFLVTQLVSIGKGTPFAGLAGDPNIQVFFNFNANVLYIRQVLLPAVPLLLLMKYAAQGPPNWMIKYAPNFITMNYWEICYFLHYFTALTAIIVLVIYRAQVFYWMGTTWGVIWGGNRIIRILRTRKCTIQKSELISYTVEDSRNNAKKRSDVLRITLNVPSSFPSSARGQACWITVPEIDYVAHPFTLAKTPTEKDNTIMFHIAVRYIKGDDVISGAKPSSAPGKNVPPPPSGAEAGALPPGWKSALDPTSNQTYYYNTAEKRTTWTRPNGSAADKLFDGFRGLTSRISANFLRGNSSAKFGGLANLQSAQFDAASSKNFVMQKRATWTQKFANMARRIQNLDPQLRANAMKNHPIYVNAPIGTSMDEAIQNSVPGSVIITTQNGLPAAESCVRWLLLQEAAMRPKFHFFVSVSREVNDALAVVEMLREAMIESVNRKILNVDGLNGKHAHMCDWLGIYIHLTRRKGNTILGDREMLFNALSPPKQQIDPKRLELIDTFIKSRVCPGRLQFDRFLARTQQLVKKRSGDNRMVVAYCGSSKVAGDLRVACRNLKNVSFDGEYI